MRKSREGRPDDGLPRFVEFQIVRNVLKCGDCIEAPVSG